MAKNFLLLFVGGAAIYGAIMIDLNLVREGQKAAIVARAQKAHKTTEGNPTKSAKTKHKAAKKNSSK